jgi:hypothetical protein
VNGSRPQDGARSSGIPKWMVREAYHRVKASKGAPGVDGVTIGQFGQDLQGSLYKLRGSHVVRLVLPSGGQGRGGSLKQAGKVSVCSGCPPSPAG